jgi:hypothetical protein
MFRYGAIGSKGSSLSLCNPSLEFDIKPICEDGSTSHVNKVTRLALVLVSEMVMEPVGDGCSRASSSKSTGLGRVMMSRDQVKTLRKEKRILCGYV